MCLMLRSPLTGGSATASRESRDKMSYCLVTGGAGFIGSHVVAELLRRKMRVVVVDALSSIRGLLPEGATLVAGDIADPGPVRDAMAAYQPRYVFHLAAKRSVPDSFKSPWEYLQTNVMGTMNVLRACAGTNVRRVVMASSS